MPAAVLLAVLPALLLPATAARGQQPPPVAFVGGTVIDGTGAPPLDGGVVLLRNGRIACVGTPDACPVPDDARVVDAAGRWIVPGLVDAHVHYSQTGWADGRPDALDVRERFPYDRTIHELEHHPDRFYRAYLCSGVTATFDVGGFPWTWDLREDAEARTDAPHVAAAGPLLSTRDHWLNLPGERQFLFMSDPEAVDAAARYLVTNRTDAVKVWYLVGEDSPERDRFSELLRVGARRAEEADVPLIVHATGLWQAKDALRAGARLLVHSVYDRAVDDEFLSLARDAGTYYTPTLIVSRGYQDLRARRFRPEAQPLECLDPATRAKAFLTDSLPGGPGPRAVAEAARAAEDRFRLMASNLRRIHEAGIPVVVGTDAGNPLTLHGASVFAEMEAMQEAGLSPMEVLVAATRNGARAMGRGEDLGTLEDGKIADLVVLEADPTADVANARRIQTVVRGGRLWDRGELTWP